VGSDAKGVGELPEQVASPAHGHGVAQAIKRRARNALPLAVGDILLIVVSWIGAVLLRYETDIPVGAWADLAGFLPLVLATTLVFHGAAGVYAGVLGFASILEARQILIAQFATLIVLLPAVWALGRPVPLSVPIIATVLCCGAAGATRFWSRLVRWRQLADADADVDRLVVIGAGEAGGALVKDIQQRRAARVVAFIDDDDRLWGLRIHGVRVQGPLSDLGPVAETTGATRAVLAIPAAGPELVRRMATGCSEHGIGLSVVPPPSELLGRQVSLQDVRDLGITDLLGRAQVETDLDEIVAFVRGRRVLITGGGGSIGSELARQVASFEPARLVLLDHDETHLFDAAAGLPLEAVQRLADIRDETALALVFAEERPEIVFHAAAHKHVPLLEAHPVQAAHTNVLGTRNVIECAARVGVSRFVFISTDKAVRPSSVMGATKLAGEHLVLSGDSEMTCCAVRFGNVLGSRGSVVPTFVRQIRAGGPVTITDGRMTRYFMSIPEAVRLVLHAAALSRGGEIFMLDMGEPVRIIDLARRMIQLSGQRPGADVEIRVTEVRPGEKLAEQLHAPEERQHPTSHPSIVRLEPVKLPAQVIRSAVLSIVSATALQDGVEVRTALHQLRGAREHLTEPIAAHPTSTRMSEERAWI